MLSHSIISAICALLLPVATARSATRSGAELEICALPPPVKIPAAERCTFSKAKQQALNQLVKTYKGLCVAKGSKYIPTVYFQEELSRLSSKYTMPYLDSIDRANEDGNPAATKSKPPSAKNTCDFEVVFTTAPFNSYFSCEVFGRGDRDFMVSEMYLFEIKGKSVVLLAKKEINYN